MALREFGRIPKSAFLLRYIAILDLRPMVEKHLNTGENVHKFSRAVACGNTQACLSGEKLEQESAEAGRRLSKNAIICWNYLDFSQKIAAADSAARRQELLTAVRNGSGTTWQHINLQGEDDFSDAKLRDSGGLDAPNIAPLKDG